jgi:hypothetical protein
LASSAFSKFPVILAILLDKLAKTPVQTVATLIQDLITSIETDVAEARNNLLQVKVFQTYYTNQN